MTSSGQTCVATGKIRWRKRSGAHRHAKELDRKGRRAKTQGAHKGKEAYVYECSYCEGFHVATGDRRARWGKS